jgi:hypothetical protein
LKLPVTGFSTGAAHCFLFCAHAFIFTLIASIIAHLVAAHLASASAYNYSGCYIRQVVQKPHKPHAVSCSFWALYKAAGVFFRSGTVNHLQTTHFSANLHVPAMRLLSQIQLNQASQNGIFVVLPRLSYCISCETRSSDIPTPPHSSTKSPNLNHSLINTKKLCSCGATSLLS